MKKLAISVVVLGILGLFGVVYLKYFHPQIVYQQITSTETNNIENDVVPQNNIFGSSDLKIEKEPQNKERVVYGNVIPSKLEEINNKQPPINSSIINISKPVVLPSPVEVVLPKTCGILHQGSKDNTKAINFIIIPADSLFGDLQNKSEAQYSNNIGDFISDARKNVDIFFQTDPVNKYENIFNFYYASSLVAKCVLLDHQDYVECNGWKEAADSCQIPYDQVIIMQRKEGGGLNGGPWIQTSAYTTTTFIHEIGHSFGFRDWNDLRLPVGPNDCTSLSDCGKALCPFQDYSQEKSVESGFPICAIFKGTVGNTDFYRSNEENIMDRDYNLFNSKFNTQEKLYLNELFSQILSKGKSSVKCGPWFILDKYCPSVWR